jgi:MFS family permease
MMSWVAEITPSTHLGRAYGWYTTALFCGLGLGPAFGGVLGEWLGYRAVFAIGAALVAVNLWSVQRFLPATATAGAPRQSQAARRPNSGRNPVNRPLIGSWLGTFGANIIAGVFFTFMPLLAHARGLDADQIGLIYLTQAVSNAVSRIPFGAISDRIGRRKYQALSGVCLATLAIAAFAQAVSFLHFLLAALFLGISLAIAFTAIGALIAETSDPRSRGLAMGGYNTFIYFGLMAGSIGFGPLIETVGFDRGFALAGASNLLFTACFAYCMKGYVKNERS